MQPQLFDPYADDRGQDAARRRARVTPAQAEQLVLGLIMRAGGELRGDRLLRAGLEAGLDSDAVGHAVHVLESSRRLASDGSVLRLVA